MKQPLSVQTSPYDAVFVAAKKLGVPTNKSDGTPLIVDELALLTHAKLPVASRGMQAVMQHRIAALQAKPNFKTLVRHTIG